MSSATPVEVPDRKSIVPDPPRRKVPMSVLSCCQNFYCIHRAFKSPHVQTFMNSKLSMSRLSCVPKENSCAPKLIICAFMSRLLFGQKTLCQGFRAFKIAYVQTFVRPLVFSDRVILNARHPPSAFILVWTYQLSVWHLNLGTLQKSDLGDNFKPTQVYSYHE